MSFPHPELRNGVPVLSINHGSGTLTLQLPSTSAINDRRWHHLDILSDGKVRRTEKNGWMIVDFRQDSKVNDRMNKCFLVEFMDRITEELYQYFYFFYEMLINTSNVEVNMHIKAESADNHTDLLLLVLYTHSSVRSKEVSVAECLPGPKHDDADEENN